MKFWSVVSVLIIFSILSGFGQERNFEVFPNNVTCDELPQTFENLQEALALITSAEYRLEQNFKINRKKGLKSGQYYSCDHETGYLVIQINETKELFYEVTLKDWEKLTTSNDPESLILDAFTTKYSKITE